MYVCMYVCIQVNKNLWSTSFALVNAGFGLVCLSICYISVDMYKLWSGAPFIYLGLNSILIYGCHGVLAGYFPFSYHTDAQSHACLLQMNIIGVLSWMVLAYYFKTIDFFVKV